MYADKEVCPGFVCHISLHAAAPWKMRLHCAGAEAEIELSARQSVTLNAALQPIH